MLGYVRSCTQYPNLKPGCPISFLPVSTLRYAVQQRIYNEIQIHDLLFAGPPMSSVVQSLATGDD